MQAEVCPKYHLKLRNTSRPEDCLKDITFIGHIASLLTVFLSGIDHCGPFSYFQSFLNIFQNILKALFRVYIIKLINMDPRISRGCLQYPPEKITFCIFFQLIGFWKTISFHQLTGSRLDEQLLLSLRNEKKRLLQCFFIDTKTRNKQYSMSSQTLCASNKL